MPRTLSTYANLTSTTTAVVGVRRTLLTLLTVVFGCSGPSLKSFHQLAADASSGLQTLASSNLFPGTYRRLATVKLAASKISPMPSVVAPRNWARHSGLLDTQPAGCNGLFGEGGSTEALSAASLVFPPLRWLSLLVTCHRHSFDTGTVANTLGPPYNNRDLSGG